MFKGFTFGNRYNFSCSIVSGAIFGFACPVVSDVDVDAEVGVGVGMINKTTVFSF